MVINVIVVAVTLLMSGFVGVWLVCPRCRLWIEAPKWQPLAWDEPATDSSFLDHRDMGAAIGTEGWRATTHSRSACRVESEFL